MKKQAELRELRKTLVEGGDLRQAMVHLVDIVSAKSPRYIQAVKVLKGLIREGKREILASAVVGAHPEVPSGAWTQARRDLGVTVQQTKAGWLWHLPVKEKEDE